MKRALSFLLAFALVLGGIPIQGGVVKTAQAAQSSGNIEMGTIHWTDSSREAYTFPDATANFGNKKAQRLFCISVNHGGSFTVKAGFSFEGRKRTVQGVAKTADGTEYISMVDEGTTKSPLSGKELTSLSVSGTDITADQINTFLRGLIFHRNGVSADTKQNVSVAANETNLSDDEIAMAVGGEVHYYRHVQFKDASLPVAQRATWYDAYRLAKEATLNGMHGYLATITEENEENYLFHAFGGDIQAWIGGARVHTLEDKADIKFSFDEKVIADDALDPGGKYGDTYTDPARKWYWMCGPEAGQAFYQTNFQGNAYWGDGENEPRPVNGMYNDWNLGEPNNNVNISDERATYKAEYALEYGYERENWNDYSPYNVTRGGYGMSGYIIEFSPYTLEDQEGVNKTKEEETTPSVTGEKEVVATDEDPTPAPTSEKKEPTLDAHSFLISGEDAKNLTEDDAKKRAEVTAVDSEGENVPSDSNAISADPDVIQEMKQNGNGKYDLPFTYEDPETGKQVTETVQATVLDKVSPAEEGDDTKAGIGANHFEVTLEQAKTIEEAWKNKDKDAKTWKEQETLLKLLANATAQEDGEIIDPAGITVTSCGIQAKKTEGGQKDQVTFAYKGKEVTVDVTVKDNGSETTTVVVTANDFTWRILEGTVDQETFIEKAQVTAKASDGSDAEIVVDAGTLAALNKAITDNKPGDYKVKVTGKKNGLDEFTYVTVHVVEYPLITANDILIGRDELDGVTEEIIKDKTDAKRVETETDSGDPASVGIKDSTQVLEELKQQKDKEEPEKVTITFQDTSGENPSAQEKTITVQVKDEVDSGEGSGEGGQSALVSLGANHFALTMEQAEKIVSDPDGDASKTLIRTLADAVAINDGKAVDSAQIAVKSDEIRAQVGKYPVTFTYWGREVTVNATVSADPDAKLGKKDFEVTAGSENVLTKDEFIEKAEITIGGETVTTDDVVINDLDLEELNKAIERGDTGTKTVRIEDPKNGTKDVVTVTVKAAPKPTPTITPTPSATPKPSATPIKQEPVLNVHSFLISEADAEKLTADDAKERAEAAAVDSKGDGVPAASDAIQADTDAIQKIKQGGNGQYDLPFTFEDPVSKEKIDQTVKVTVLDKVENYPAGSEDDAEISIGANQFEVTLEQAKKIEEAWKNKTTAPQKWAEQEALIRQLARATAEEDGTVVDQSKITITSCDIQAKKTEGYQNPVTFSYNGKTVTINAAVKDDGSETTTIVVTANDFTVQMGPDHVLKDAKEFIQKAEVTATAPDGSEADIVINASDLEKLNDAIKNNQPGDYEVKVTGKKNGLQEDTIVTVHVVKYPLIMADDILIGRDELADVTEDLIKDKADAKRVENEDDPGDPDQVGIKDPDKILEELKKQQQEEDPDDILITFEDTSGDPSAPDKTITVKVKDEVDSGTGSEGGDPSVVVSLGANNFKLTMEQAKEIVKNPSSDKLMEVIRKLADAEAVNDGKAVDPAQIAVDATKIQAKVGDSYPVVFTYWGRTVTVNAEVLPDPDAKLEAKDFTVPSGSDNTLTVDEFIEKAQVTIDGESVTKDDVTVNPSDLDELNEAIKRDDIGKKTVRVTDSNGTTIFVTVTITDAKSSFRMTTENFILTLDEAKGLNADEAKERGDVAVIIDDNTVLDWSDHRISPNAELLNRLKTKGSGKYKLPYMYETDDQEAIEAGRNIKTSRVLVSDVVTRINGDADKNSGLGADHFDLSLDQAKAIENAYKNRDKDPEAWAVQEEIIRAFANPTGMQDGRTIDQGKIQLVDCAIKGKKSSGYPVTFRWTDEDDTEHTVIVKASVRDKAATTQDLTSVDDLRDGINLTANDFIVKAKSGALDRDTFLKMANVAVKDVVNDVDNKITLDDPKMIVVQEGHLDGLNKAIKDGELNTYPVQVYYQGSDSTVIDNSVIVYVTVVDNLVTATDVPASSAQPDASPASRGETIGANNVTLDLDKLDEQLRDIINIADAQAYDTDSKEELALTPDTSEVKKEEGTYDVYFTTDRGTSLKIEVTVKKGGSPEETEMPGPSDTSDPFGSGDPTGTPASTATGDPGLTSPTPGTSSDPGESKEPPTSGDPQGSTSPSPTGTPAGSAAPGQSPSVTPTPNPNGTFTPEQNAKADEFIRTYVTGKDGVMIVEISDLTRDIIASGETAWNQMSDAEKQAVNSKLKASGNPYTYEQLLEMAKQYKIPGFKLRKVMKKKTKARLKLVKCKGATIICTSTNPKVATVNKKGVIKAKKVGKTTLTFTAVKGDYTNRLVVKIIVRKKFRNAKELKSFKTNVIKTPTVLIAKKRLLKKSTKLRVYNLESDATVKYKSFNPKVLKITKKGKYTGKKLGKTLVRVTINQNNKVYLLYINLSVFKKGKKKKS